MELVTVFIDDQEIKVPKGTNIIEVARMVGIEIPHYCYHPHLSIAGNCRMCQVQIEGQPKLAIGCNTSAVEGLKIRTQATSPEVQKAQAATLEFLLINHPLDCTVCDQAGHCKLQDYYYDYDAKPSRFVEDKVRKVKAEVLGPEIVYDGERCIVCTRCVRFCDEATETHELGVFNRGDRAVIGAYPGKELDNPLSGSVVDLCPVGALTHKRWRFNTRIWYTSEEETICTGCSTGCNAKVASRDGKIVHVKARLNREVNKEWMCNEGRYGFERFQPSLRLTDTFVRKADSFLSCSWEEVAREAKRLADSNLGAAAIFLSPFLTLEEMWSALQFAKKVLKIEPDSGRIAVQIKGRELTPVEAILVSPDYAPNARGAVELGLSQVSSDWRAAMQQNYERLLNDVRNGTARRILTVGDFAIADSDLDSALEKALSVCEVSIALTPRAAQQSALPIVSEAWNNSAHLFHRVLLPGQTVNEKHGVMVNKDGRFQRLRPVLQPPVGTLPDWILLQKLARGAGVELFPPIVNDERSLFRQMVSEVSSFSGLTLMKLGTNGLKLNELKEAVGTSAAGVQA